MHLRSCPPTPATPNSSLKRSASGRPPGPVWPGEHVFFDYEDVKVTNSRFVVNAQTFALSAVISFRATEKEPSRILPALLLVGGALFTVLGAYPGLVLAAIGAAWALSQTTEYHIVLDTAAGQRTALKTHKVQYFEAVLSALNKAIACRG